MTVMPYLQVGMWVIPVGLCLRNHWWRFPCVWLAFSGITGVVTKKCTEKPIDVSGCEDWQQRTGKERKRVIKQRKREKDTWEKRKETSLCESLKKITVENSK